MIDYKNFIQMQLAQGVQLNISEAISGGFRHLGKSIGSYAGFTIVMFLILIMGSLFSAFIPFVGGLLVSVLLSPALMMGYAIYARKKDTEPIVSFESFFDAFKTNFTQLIIFNLILQVVLLGLSSLLIVPFLGDIMTMVQNGQMMGDPEIIEEMMGEMTASFIKYWWVFIIYAVVAMVIQILYSLTNYFIIFYGFGFWEAMEASRQLVGKVFFQILIINILMGFIAGIGTILTLGIGLLFLIPAINLVNFNIFEQVAGFGNDEEIPIEEDLIV